MARVLKQQEVKPAPALTRTRAARKASGRLADDLKSLILRDGLKPGDRLPSLDEIARQSGYSPAIVRESLRILENEGLVDVRRGITGGVFVRNPDYESIARSLRLLLRFNRDDPRTVLEARRELETVCTRLAAEHISVDELAELRASVARHRRLEDSEAAARENLFFHLAVVRCARNRILRVLVEAVRSFLYDSTVNLFYRRENIVEAAEAHGKIVDALASRDPALAAKRMWKHMQAFEAYLAETGQGAALLNEPNAERGALGDSPARPSSSRIEVPSEHR